MAKKPLRIGIIGCGFMGRAHSNAYAKVGHFFDSDYQVVLQAACARNEDAVKSFAARWGYRSVETDWRKLLKRDDIDVVDICTPNNTHAEIAIAAAKAGKAILCEKPLGLNAPEAEKMVAAVAKAKVPNMVWYNYRRCPAVVLVKNLIDEGKPLTLFGDGSASVDFVYVGDVVRANLLACDAKAKDAIVNVCSGVETRMKDLAELLLELTGSTVGIEFKPQPPGALPARRYGDPRRAEELLGFRAETTLADGLRALIKWRSEALAATRR